MDICARRRSIGGIIMALRRRIWRISIGFRHLESNGAIILLSVLLLLHRTGIIISVATNNHEGKERNFLRSSLPCIIY